VSDETIRRLEREKQRISPSYVIIRSARAGVFAGFLLGRDNQTVTMGECRRLWYWSGAASLSEMAIHGTSKPGDCKFPVAVPEMVVMEVIEILPCSSEAKTSIASVPVWSARSDTNNQIYH
jgi:hypothetical protein